MLLYAWYCWSSAHLFIFKLTAWCVYLSLVWEVYNILLGQNKPVELVQLYAVAGSEWFCVMTYWWKKLCATRRTHTGKILFFFFFCLIKSASIALVWNCSNNSWMYNIYCGHKWTNTFVLVNHYSLMKSSQLDRRHKQSFRNEKRKSKNLKQKSNSYEPR